MGFAAVTPAVFSVSSLSLSVAREGVPRGTVDVALSRSARPEPSLVPSPRRMSAGSRGRGVRVVEVVHRRCAGIDIGKRGATVCVRVAGAGRRATQETVTSWGSMTNQILALREHLLAEQVSCVVMEATGDYVRREGA